MNYDGRVANYERKQLEAFYECYQCESIINATLKEPSVEVKSMKAERLENDDNI